MLDSCNVHCRELNSSNLTYVSHCMRVARFHASLGTMNYSLDQVQWVFDCLYVGRITAYCDTEAPVTCSKAVRGVHPQQASLPARSSDSTLVSARGALHSLLVFSTLFGQLLITSIKCRDSVDSAQVGTSSMQGVMNIPAAAKLLSSSHSSPRCPPYPSLNRNQASRHLQPCYSSNSSQPATADAAPSTTTAAAPAADAQAAPAAAQPAFSPPTFATEEDRFFAAYKAAYTMSQL